MFLFKKLQTQTSDENNQDDQKLPSRKLDEDFDLHEQVDESTLDEFWNKVEQDIQKDPEWFKFTQ